MEAIGRTPLIKVGPVYAKLEAVNPGGSIKDRVALRMVEAAESEGKLKPGGLIVEPTSGNTGIALSMVAAVKGYRMMAVMPDNMSLERRKIMQAFGAEIVLTPASESLPGAIKKAEELAQEKNAFLPQQFQNHNNLLAHHETGREILEQVGKVDAFVAGMGTAGTLMGVSQALKKANPGLHVVAVEPKEKDHGIQGIGDGLNPPLADLSQVDEVVKVSTDEAKAMAAKLAREHGLLVGYSSGANMLAAFELAKRFERVVTVLPDRGERYLTLQEEREDADL